MKIINKKGQEEIVGFAIIVIIVAIILLFMLSFYIRSDSGSGVESFEANSFLQSSLHVTTDCLDNRGDRQDIQDLIYQCSNDQQCRDGEDTCDVLEETLEKVVGSAWPVGEDRPVKGYSFLARVREENIINMTEGSETANYREGFQEFVMRGDRIRVNFRAYYG